MHSTSTSKSILYFRSLIYQIAFLSSVVIFASLVIIFFFTSVDTRLKIIKQYGNVNSWLLKKICKLDYIIEGEENIPSDNAIVLSKHQSTWETITLNQIIPQGRWVFKRELMFIPFFGIALALTSPISINRSAGLKAVSQIVQQGTKILKQGKWIIMFPEGTRTKPGDSSKYKIGGALLAEKSGYPILPIAHNAGEFWPKHSFIKWPGTITLRIGPIITSENKKAKQILAEVHEWIETQSQIISDSNRWNRKA